MKANIPLEYYERAAEILRYDPETGRLIWQVATSRNIKEGNEAGIIHNKGYRRVGITIDGKFKLLLTHRIIYFIHHGELPDMLDHRDGNPLNNRIENLRPATRQQNQQNQRSYKNSSSKYLGVSWQKKNKKWRAQIQINGEKRCLGLFDDEIEAAKAYDAGAREHFGEFANPNFPQSNQI